MIETVRLVLRPVMAEDRDTFVQELNNFNITRNTGRVPYPYSLQDAVDYLKFVEELHFKSCVRAIAHQHTPEKLIGAVAYLYSAEKDNAELGYWLSESEWGKGFMTEAAIALVDRAFKVSKVETLIACFQKENPASGRVLSKLGFSETGQVSRFSKARGLQVPVTRA